jgi:hypothetical protein
MRSAIFKAMQMNPHTNIMKTPDAIVSIYHPSIIRRIWDIQSYNMQIHCSKGKKIYARSALPITIGITD